MHYGKVRTILLEIQFGEHILRRIQGQETADFRGLLRDEREHRFCIGRRRGQEGIQTPGVPSVAEQGHHREAIAAPGNHRPWKHPHREGLPHPHPRCEPPRLHQGFPPLWPPAVLPV